MAAAKKITKETNKRFLKQSFKLHGNSKRKSIIYLESEVTISENYIPRTTKVIVGNQVLLHIKGKDIEDFKKDFKALADKYMI